MEACSHAEALQRAGRAGRLLLVFLHSDLHPDGDAFVRHVLGSAEVCGALEAAGALSWAGCVQEPDGFAAAERLEAVGFPYVGLYARHDGAAGSGPDRGAPTYQRLWVSEGLLPPAALAAEVLRCGTAIRAAEDRVVAREAARHEERQLRVEQQSEYQAALAADEAREREAAAAAAAAAEEEAKAEAEADAAAEAAELEAAIALSRELDTKGTAEAARARLAGWPEPPAPAPGAGAGAAPAVITLRITLPSGTRLDRRFPAAAPLSVLADYVTVAAFDSGRPVPLAGFDVACAFPKRVFPVRFASRAALAAVAAAGGGGGSSGSAPEPADLSQSLADCGLTNRAVLFVTDALG